MISNMVVARSNRCVTFNFQLFSPSSPANHFLLIYLFSFLFFSSSFFAHRVTTSSRRNYILKEEEGEGEEEEESQRDPQFSNSNKLDNQSEDVRLRNFEDLSLGVKVRRKRKDG